VRRHCMFYQAEDGIRGFHVTGVQTCARPIGAEREQKRPGAPTRILLISGADRHDQTCPGEMPKTFRLASFAKAVFDEARDVDCRSEERRVGEEGGTRRRANMGTKCEK